MRHLITSELGKRILIISIIAISASALTDYMNWSVYALMTGYVAGALICSIIYIKPKQND